jgi:hypothetical protein
VTILQAMADENLFAPWFRGDSWNAWKAFLAALFNLRMDDASVSVYRAHTGRLDAPPVAYRESYVIAGRRSGKSLIAALVATYLATFGDYRHILAPGEKATIMLLAADKRQARTLFRYIEAFFEVPMLARLVGNKLKESIELTNNVVIEIHVSNFRSVRGYSIVCAIADEAAFWPTDDSANPDVEVVNALRPAMATIPSALLLGISSPYARRGLLWQMWREHFGKAGAPVLVWQAPTETMNPTVPHRIIQAAYAADQASAAAEYGAEFRTDVESLLPLEAVEGCVIPGRHELPPLGSVTYTAFVDPSGGSNDSMTMAIAHDDHGTRVLDALREVAPPFSPESVVSEFAATLKTYRVHVVTGDRYGGEWPREQFRKHGIEYKCSEKSKSDIYLELLPLIMSSKIELLDNKKLLRQLVGLERRVARGGKDSIAHSPGGHDDLVNSAAGALALRGKLTHGFSEFCDAIIAAGGVDQYFAQREREHSDREVTAINPKTGQRLKLDRANNCWVDFESGVRF